MNNAIIILQIANCKLQIANLRNSNPQKLIPEKLSERLQGFVVLIGSHVDSINLQFAIRNLLTSIFKGKLSLHPRNKGGNAMCNRQLDEVFTSTNMSKAKGYSESPDLGVIAA